MLTDPGLPALSQSSQQSAILLSDSEVTTPQRKPAREPEWISSVPPPEFLQPESFNLAKKSPASTWTYTDELGVPVGYVCRYDGKEEKTYRQWSYGHLEGTPFDSWEMRHFSRPRPLYNLHEILIHGDVQLLVVEGEKCADAARKALPRQAVTTWPGGALAAAHADWSVLAGRERKVAVLWPDADDPGRAAMSVVGEALFLLGYELWLIPVDGKPKGWDVSDAVEAGEFIPAILKTAIEWFPSHAIERARTPAKAVKRLPPTLVGIPASERPVEPTRDPNARWRVDDWVALGLEIRNAKPIDNASNVALILAQEYRGRIWYDEFTKKVMSADAEGYNVREWIDGDDINLLVDIQRRCALVNSRKSTIQDAVIMHALGDIRNEVRDWLRSLLWDGTPRIDHFFDNYCDAEPSLYIESVSRNFFISLVA